MKTVTMYANKHFLEEIQDDDVSNLSKTQNSDYKTKITFQIEGTKTFTESEIRAAINATSIGKSEEGDKFVDDLFFEPKPVSKVKKKSAVEEEDDWD